jgi:hypothetical protein
MLFRLFITYLLVGASGLSAEVPSKNLCESYLGFVGKHVAAESLPSATELRTLLAKEELPSQFIEDLVSIYELQEIFNAPIVVEITYATFLDRMAKSSSRDYIRHFDRIDDEQEQFYVVTAIVERLLHLLPPSVDSRFAPQFEQLAKDFGMGRLELETIVRTIEKNRQADPQLWRIRSTIHGMLLSFLPAFQNKLQKRSGLLGKVSNLFSDNHFEDLSLPPNIRGEFSPDFFVEDRSEFYRHLQDLNIEARRFFIGEHLHRFGHHDFKALSDRERFSVEFSETWEMRRDLVAQINEKVEALKKIAPVIVGQSESYTAAIRELRHVKNFVLTSQIADLTVRRIVDSYVPFMRNSEFIEFLSELIETINDSSSKLWRWDDGHLIALMKQSRYFAFTDNELDQILYLVRFTTFELRAVTSWKHESVEPRPPLTHSRIEADRQLRVQLTGELRELFEKAGISQSRADAILASLQ